MTDSKKLMPTARACTTASQASHSANTPTTRRSGAGMRGQPATPARSSQALPSTQNAPAPTHRGIRVRSVSPNTQEAAHKATHTAPMATEPTPPAPLRRPHSHAAPAISTSTTAAKGSGDG